jgi:hypothetical protein
MTQAEDMREEQIKLKTCSLCLLVYQNDRLLSWVGQRFSVHSVSYRFSDLQDHIHANV